MLYYLWKTPKIPFTFTKLRKIQKSWLSDMCTFIKNTWDDWKKPEQSNQTKENHFIPPKL